MIDVTVRDEVALITLARPEKLNALTAGMRLDLAAAVRACGRTARGIVVTGAGRAFSAGEDIAEAAGKSLVAEVELFHDLTRAVLETQVPVVAAVNGLAVGGAAEWTLCFDTRIGSPAAEYFLPENHLGLSISNAAGYLLPRLAGGRALRLVLDSARLSAAEAVAAGLLDEIVPAEELVEAAIARVRHWTGPGTATAVHLRLLRPPLAEVERAFEAETEAARHVEKAGLAQAGMTRFLTRRTP
ncbi:enoyl-CoA hydratase/isomerase family protein [Nonomuraea spiralis]|uniref:Enoyl-CoA hydratase/isomerase family protein n=1 Tax=Nonomuraea spiralis TaxID=46182 RepID=A0ABV5IP99_9ACTN|nr:MULTISPECIES: enoyl-CoA hydratase/isomerase family protein [Nonomuraea]RSN00226.1 enoyl-CoA hydratase/isomerase family protein [Nonomuraea sp. WAC 01424]GGT14925.1 enoyl-CoA hydratase [Nonomuraea spiralis]